MTDPARIRLLDSEAVPGEANPAPIIRLGGHAAHAPLTLRQARKAVRAEKRRARRRLREARRSAKAVAKEQIRQSERLALGAAAAAHAEAIARLRQLEESTTLSKQEQTAQRVRLKEAERAVAAGTIAAKKTAKKAAKSSRTASERVVPERQRVRVAKLSRAKKRQLELAERTQELLRVSSSAPGEMPQYGPPKYSWRWFFPSRPKATEVATSLTSLAFFMRMLKGDLEPVARQAEIHAGTSLGDLYSRVAWRMAKEQKSLVAAFEPEPIIPDLVKSFMQVGGKSTSLPDQITEAASLMVAAESSSKELVFNLLEPFATAIASLAMLVWISATVVPQQAAQYTTMNIPVPPITAASMVIGQGIVWTAAGLVLLIALLAAWWFGLGTKSKRSREVIDRAKLSLPLYGPLGRTSQGYQTALFMTALLRARKTEVEALRETAAASTNRSTSFALYALADALGDGRTTLAELADGVHLPKQHRYVLAAMITGGHVLDGFSAVRDQLATELAQMSKRFRFLLTSLGVGVSTAIYLSAMLLVLLPTFEQGTAFTSLL